MRRSRGSGRQGAAKGWSSLLQLGDVVAEVRAGLVCECGAIETVFRTEPQARLTCVSRAGSPSLLSTRSPASPARPLRRSRQGAFKDAPPLLSRSFGWARKGARIGVISLLAAAVLSSCIGGSALQGTPVQDPSVVTFLSNFTGSAGRPCLRLDQKA